MYGFNLTLKVPAILWNVFFLSIYELLMGTTR